MKLLHCYIDNFGKLSDVSINFSPGLSVFQEENAWGKSTLAAFLKVMFYGFDTKKESGAFEKERIFYRPWQGGNYGGEVDFTVHGKSYRMVRSFGKTEKTDSFRLYDLSTNLESRDFTRNIGEEIFDLDRASFARSIYIAQNDCESTSTDAINAKLGNLAENTNDINNFENACAKLNDKMNKLSPDRITGSLKARKNQISELLQELRSYEAAEESYEKVKIYLEQAIDRKENLEEERNRYAKSLEKASYQGRRIEQVKAYENLCTQEREKQSEYQAMRLKFPKNMPSLEELEEKQKDARHYEEYQTTLENIDFSDNERSEYLKVKERLNQSLNMSLNEHMEEIDGKLSKLNEISDLKENIAELKNNEPIFQLRLIQQRPGSLSSRSQSGMGILAGIVLMLLGIGLGIAGSYQFAESSSALIFLVIGIAAGMIGILFLVVSIIDRSRKYTAWRMEQRQQQEEWETIKIKLMENGEEINRLEDQITAINEDIKAYLFNYGLYCEPAQFAESLYELKTLRTSYELMNKRNEAYELTGDRIDRSRTGIEDFLRKYGFQSEEDISTQLQKIINDVNECKRLLNDWKRVEQQRKDYEAEHNMEDLQNAESLSLSLEECSAGIRRCDQNLEELRDNIDAYRRQMESLQEQMDLRDEKERLLEEYGKLQMEETEKYRIYQQTVEFLTKAREQFTSRYMTPISIGFEKYYSLLRGDNKDQWMVDANISVQMKLEGQLRETRSLSAGYQDLIGICMRLALADAMYPGEKPFLIFDDPFVNLDEGKVARGNALLEHLAEDYQVIYFTCHDSRAPRIENNYSMSYGNEEAYGKQKEIVS